MRSTAPPRSPTKPAVTGVSYLRALVPAQAKQQQAAAPLQLAAAAGASATTLPAAAQAAQAMPSNSNSFAALTDAAEEVEDRGKSSTAGTSNRAESTSDDGASGSPRQRRKLKQPLIWIDLEMTGLDIDKDTIIEIAVIATDGDLTHMIEGPATAIHHGEDVLSDMNEWCIEHHGKSGLTQRVRESQVSMAEVEQQVLEFIQQHTDENGAQLAGNSIHVDRMFLNKYMPKVIAYLNYRIVDVSSVKELARRWFPVAFKKAPRKALAHTALSDIRESIEELKYYRKAVFKPINK